MSDLHEADVGRAWAAPAGILVDRGVVRLRLLGALDAPGGIARVARDLGGLEGGVPVTAAAGGDLIVVLEARRLPAAEACFLGWIETAAVRDIVIDRDVAWVATSGGAPGAAAAFAALAAAGVTAELAFETGRGAACLVRSREVDRAVRALERELVRHREAQREERG
jgi:hypothetical protein